MSQSLQAIMTHVASVVRGAKKIPLCHPLNQKTAATAFTVTLLLQLRVLVHSSPLLATTNDVSTVHLPVLESNNNLMAKQVAQSKSEGENVNLLSGQFNIDSKLRRNIRSAGSKRSLFLPPSDPSGSSNSAHSSSGTSYVVNSNNVVAHLNSASIPSHSLSTGSSNGPNIGSGGSATGSGSNGDLYFDPWTQQPKYPYYFAVHELLPHNLTVVLIKWQPLPAIRVSWDFDPQLKCDAFRVLYHPIASKYRYIVEVPCSIKNITIERLLPNTEYILTVNPVPAPAPISLVSSASIHQHQHHQQQQQLHPDSSFDHSNTISDGKTIKQGQNYHLSNSKGSTSNSLSSSATSSPSTSSSASSSSSSSASPPSSSPHLHPQYSHKYWLTHPNQYTSNIGRGPMISPPNVIRFISPQVEFNRFSSKFRSSSLIVRRPEDHFDPESSVVVKTGELAVVLFVLSGWILMIVIFVKKWGKIRGIETVSSFHGTNAASVLAFPAGQGSNVVNGNVSSAATLVPFSVSNSGALRAQRSRESDESNSNEVSVSGIVAVSANTSLATGQMAAGSIKKKRLEEAIHQFLMSHQQLKQSSVTSAPIQCKSSCSNSSYEQQQSQQQQQSQGQFSRSMIQPRTVKSQESAPRSTCYIHNCRCISPHYEHHGHNRWSCHASRILATSGNVAAATAATEHSSSSPYSPPSCTGFNDRHRSSLDHLDVYFTQSNIKSTSSDELKSIRDPRMNRSAENLLQLDFDM